MLSRRSWASLDSWILVYMKVALAVIFITAWKFSFLPQLQLPGPARETALPDDLITTAQKCNKYKKNGYFNEIHQKRVDIVKSKDSLRSNTSLLRTSVKLKRKGPIGVFQKIDVPIA